MISCPLGFHGGRREGGREEGRGRREEAGGREEAEGRMRRGEGEREARRRSERFSLYIDWYMQRYSRRAVIETRQATSSTSTQQYSVYNVRGVVE